MDRSGLFPLAALGIVAGFVAVLLMLSGSEGDAPDDPPPAPSTISATTSPTTAVPATTSPAPGAPPAATPVEVLDGWEDLEAPFGRRWNAAAVWTGSELLVWGGDQGDQPFDSYNDPTNTGYAYEVERGRWRRLPASDLCPAGRVRGEWTGTEMVVWAAGGVNPTGDCRRSGAYDPSVNRWRVLDSDFFRIVGADTHVVWTGELLVAPGVELAMDPTDGSIVDLPSLRRHADEAVFSPRRAHWTGEEVLVLGSADLYRWAPGDPEWSQVEGPPIAERARTSAWDGERLLAVTYEMAAAWWEGTSWAPADPLPLRFYECVPEGLVSEAVLVVEYCGPFALWDEVRRLFVPVPPPVDQLAYRGWLGGRPAVGGGNLFVIGDGAFRYPVVGDDEGRMMLPPTMPIGVHFLDVPGELELVGAVGASPLGGDGMVFRFATTGAVCSATSAYLGEAVPAGEPTPALLIFSRTGEVVRASEYVDEGEFTIRLPSRNGSDVVDVTCGDRDTTRQLAQQFWEPE